MSIITSSLSPEMVAESIEANLTDSSLAMGRTEDGVVFRGSDVAWVYTGKKSLSRVLRPRFNCRDVEDRVGEISECFRHWDAPVSWIIGPTARPTQIGEVLLENGYGNQESCTGMAFDLMNAFEPSFDQTDGIRIDRIRDPDSLAAWASIVDDGATASSETETAVSLLTPENAARDPRCRYYLGYLDGKPVSRGMAFLRGDTVGLYWIESLPGFRDGGIQRAGVERQLIRKALSDARRGGAVTAVALAGSRLRRLLNDLDFESYCQFRVYSWPPAPIKMPLH